MNILIACDSFKECCSAITACQSLAQGLRRSDIRVELCPLADGGEGTLDVIGNCLPLRRDRSTVTGPLGDPVQASFAWIDGMPPLGTSRTSEFPDFGNGPVAFIECASCIGLGLLHERQRNPLLTTSYGLGELMRHAEQQGAHTIVVALGGSSTVDGGMGMAQALGVRFGGVGQPAVGGDLTLVSSVDSLPLRDEARDLGIVIATDVKSPLLGSTGAARVFGPQKGATEPMVEQLERGMSHYAACLFHACLGRHETTSPLAAPTFEEAVAAPGAGAAGGIGFALQQLYRAPTMSGSDWVMQAVQFEERLERADLVITGEGRLDRSSFEGKVVSGVLARALARRIPVSIVCGSNALSMSECAARGLSRVLALEDISTDLNDAKCRVRELLAEAALVLV